MRRFIQGMAADTSAQTNTPRECLSALALDERLAEEIVRAERHQTALSCLVVRIEDIGELATAHGERLSEEAIAYLGGALRRQLRRFDRVGRPSEGELAVVLPGADERRAEAVARRALGRLHAVKIELDGVRRPLHVSVGIAAWREGVGGADMLSRARQAAGGVAGRTADGAAGGIPGGASGDAASGGASGAQGPIAGMPSIRRS